MTQPEILELIATVVAILAWPCAMVIVFWQLSKMLDDIFGNDKR